MKQQRQRYKTDIESLRDLGWQYGITVKKIRRRIVVTYLDKVEVCDTIEEAVDAIHEFATIGEYYADDFD